MKILYLKLENFIGIYNGTGKYDIEIDFTKPKSKNNIILLLGANGCGKTTLLSCLHPYSDTMDDRTTIILPERDGYKEIHIKKGKDIYVIKHHYLNKRKTKKTMSYISKNGVELNENGTVKSFESIVERELDVTPSFFVLSRIGSNVKNFIGLKPAERKNYISKFLPDVSEYLNQYKNINEKYLSVGKRIKSVTAEINKLDEEEVLNSEKIRLTKLIKRTQKSIDSIMEKINTNKGILSTMDYDKIQKNYSTAEEKIKKFTKNKSQVKVIFEDNIYNLKLEAEIDDENQEEIMNNSLKDITNELKKVEKNLTEAVTMMNTKTQESENIKAEVIKLTEELKSYKLDKDLDEFKEMENEYENKLKMLTKKKKTFDEKYKLDLEDEEVNVIRQFFKHIQEDVIFSDYDISTINYFQENFTKLKKESLLKKDKDLSKKISDAKEILKKINEDVNFYSSKLELKDILEKRPKGCTINNCEFISEALKYSDAEEKKNNLIESHSKVNEEVKEFQKELDLVKEVYNYLNDFDRLFELVKTFKYYKQLCKLIPSYFSSRKEFLDFITCDKNKFIDSFQKALEYAHIYMDEKDTTELLDEIKHNIEILESKDTLIKKTKASLDEKKNQYNSVKDEVIEYREKVSSITESKEELEEKVECYDEIVKAIQTFNKLVLNIEKYQEVIEKLSDSMNKISTLQKENEEKLIEHYELSSDFDNYNKELDDIKYKIKRLSEFKKELNDLNDKYVNIENIRKALSPTKGIPLLFVDIYLKKTKNIANNLLDIAYKGKFFIKKFHLTENDFFIKVVKDGRSEIQDVTLTSQGEMSLIGLTISFAMIQQSKKKYNIVLIDEMDKELDSENRRFFVDIIENQLKEMGIEQSFIISHNKEFDTANLDLLLFDNHDVDKNSSEYMEGRNIFYEN